MVTLTITEEQAKLIYYGLKLAIENIYDDPELANVDEDECKNDEEVDVKVFDYINENINPIVDQINKQLK